MSLSSQRRCQLTTAKGKPCPLADLGRGLCHVHDSDAEFARQHPATRACLLARVDVQRILAGAGAAKPVCQGCPNCKCCRPSVGLGTSA